jgi:hypothetical protein
MYGFAIFVGWYQLVQYHFGTDIISIVPLLACTLFIGNA